jgi:subtilase family serine protease
MNIYINMQDSSKATYVDLNVSVSKINGWIDAIEKYRTGIYIDTDTTDPSENNPYVAIQNMNKYTNDGAGSPYPTCTYDYWVYDRTNCSRNTT